MACNSPLKAFPIGYTKKGKVKYKVTEQAVQYVYQIGDVWYKGYDQYEAAPRPTEKIKRSAPIKYVSHYIDIPCGQCYECRMQRARTWADRMMMELKYHEKGYFITLTYDDEYLHKRQGVHPETGEITETASLSLEDLQGFIKRLRRQQEPEKIRYFACGEYGTRTKRPHYHLIVFGGDIPLEYFKHVDNYVYYTSEYLTVINLGKDMAIWPFGNVLVTQVDWANCAYVAQYCVDKLTGPAGELYENLNIKPPFNIMSKKPGIGYQWYNDHRDKLSYKRINISTPTGGRQCAVPRYFDYLENSLDGFVPDNAAALVAQFNRSLEDAAESIDNCSVARTVAECESSVDFYTQAVQRGRSKIAAAALSSRKDF